MRETDEWFRWQRLLEAASKFPPSTTPPLHPIENLWLIDARNGVSFLADLLALCKTHRMTTQVYFVEGLEKCV